MKSDDRILNGEKSTENTKKTVKNPRSVNASQNRRSVQKSAETSMNIHNKTDKPVTPVPLTSRNASKDAADSEKRKLAMSAGRKQSRRTVLKYLSVGVLFAVTVLTIAGICLITAQTSAKPSNTIVYSDSQKGQNHSAVPNSSGNGNSAISPIDAMDDEDIGELSDETEAENTAYPEKIYVPEDDTDTQPVYQHGELKKTASPKVTVPAAETTAEPVDLYVSRIDTDIFFETESAPEIKSEPETASPVPIDSQNYTPEETAMPEAYNLIIPETEPEPEKSVSEPVTEAPEPEPEIVYNVTLKYIQSENIRCTTTEATVGELLTSMNISLSNKDKQYIDVNQVISSDCVIQMEVSETKTLSVEETIPYDTVYSDSETVPKGTESVTTAGVSGIKVKEYINQYINGNLISETFSKEYVKQQPTNAVVEKGVGGTITGSDGTVYSYTHYMDMKATTYTGGGITASGLPADENVIAVDPNVIPLKTKVYVKGDYGDFGVRIAADIGGGIKNNIIDVYLESDNPLFANFGWKNMRVYFIEE